MEGEPESETAVADICDRLFSFWDPVQRHMLEDLFTAYRRLHPADRDAYAMVDIHHNPNRVNTTCICREDGPRYFGGLSRRVKRDSIR